MTATPPDQAQPTPPHPGRFSSWALVLATGVGVVLGAGATWGILGKATPDAVHRDSHIVCTENGKPSFDSFADGYITIEKHEEHYKYNFVDAATHNEMQLTGDCRISVVALP